jgi:hypothetical protein
MIDRMNTTHEHRYHDAAHFDAELLGEPGNLSVRITGTDLHNGTPDYKSAYVPIRLGPFNNSNEARSALETFLIRIFHEDGSKKHTYRCHWCDDLIPVTNMKRVK